MESQAILWLRLHGSLLGDYYYDDRAERAHSIARVRGTVLKPTDVSLDKPIDDNTIEAH